MTSREKPLPSNECPWCNKQIPKNKQGLIPLTIHLTKHTRTELAMLVVDWMCNGTPRRNKIK